MECNEVKEMLSEYLDNRCSVILRERVSKHLLRCRKCSDELNMLKNAVDFLKDVKDEEVPEKFYLGLNKKIEYADLSAGGKLKIFFNLKNASVALGGILLGVFLGMGIMTLLPKSSMNVAVKTENNAAYNNISSGESVNRLVVKTSNINSANGKIDELRKKFDVSSNSEDALKIIPKRYVIVVNGSNYNDFMDELNRIGFIKQEDLPMYNKNTRLTRPVRMELELEEIK